MLVGYTHHEERLCSTMEDVLMFTARGIPSVHQWVFSMYGERIPSVLYRDTIQYCVGCLVLWGIPSHSVK